MASRLLLLLQHLLHLQHLLPLQFLQLLHQRSHPRLLQPLQHPLVLQFLQRQLHLQPQLLHPLHLRLLLRLRAQLQTPHRLLCLWQCLLRLCQLRR